MQTEKIIIMILKKNKLGNIKKVMRFTAIVMGNVYYGLDEGDYFIPNFIKGRLKYRKKGDRMFVYA